MFRWCLLKPRRLEVVLSMRKGEENEIAVEAKRPCREEICEGNLVVVLCCSHVFPDFIARE